MDVFVPTSVQVSLSTLLINAKCGGIRVSSDFLDFGFSHREENEEWRFFEYFVVRNTKNENNGMNPESRKLRVIVLAAWDRGAYAHIYICMYVGGVHPEDI